MIYSGKIKKAAIYINDSRLDLRTIKAKTGCDLIFNGGVFDMHTFEPYIKLKANGSEFVSDPYSYWGYGWNTNDVGIVHSDKMNTVQNYIACVCLVRKGKAETLHVNADMGNARQRTAWGIKKDGTHVFYVDPTPTTPEELRDLMLAYGCDSALMLDGGGSTQGIFPTNTVTSERIVQNAICIWLDNGIDESKPFLSRDINLLRADVAVNCKKFMELCKNAGLNVLITCTVRNQKKQDEFYAAGTGGKTVTFHKVGNGLAFDICKNVVGQEYKDTNFFLKCAEIGERMGFTWGGRWKSVDMPHYQWDANKTYHDSDIIAGRLPPDMPVYTEAPPEPEYDLVGSVAKKLGGITPQFWRDVIAGTKTAKGINIKVLFEKIDKAL